MKLLKLHSSQRNIPRRGSDKLIITSFSRGHGPRMYFSQFRWLGSLFFYCSLEHWENQTIGSTEVHSHSRTGAEDHRFDRGSRKRMFVVVDFRLPIQLYEREFFSYFYWKILRIEREKSARCNSRDLGVYKISIQNLHAGLIASLEFELHRSTFQFNKNLACNQRRGFSILEKSKAWNPTSNLYNR